MKKKHVFGWVGGVIVLLVVTAAAGYFLFPARVENFEVEKKLQGNAEQLGIYHQIQEYEQKIKNKPEDEVPLLVSIGFDWKSLGDLTKDNFFYAKALEAYQKGIDKSEGKNIAFYWNAGKVAELMGNFTLAENYYKQAIQIAPSYGETYNYLADLYIHRLNKSQDEILAVYTDGLKGTGGDANVYLSQCSYLRSVNRTKDALDCYKILLSGYPKNEGFAQIVKELTAALKK